MTPTQALLDLADSAARFNGVPPAILKAVVEHESAWNPDAIRNEPQIQDASRGLGQLLYRTAKSIGFTGQPDDLFDPATNLAFTAKYLAFQYQRTGSWPSAVSAYNGGYAPAKGFGAPVTTPTTVILAHDPITGAVTQTRTAQPGEYGNQPYVDDVMARVDTYGGIGPSLGGFGVVGALLIVGLVAGALLHHR